MVCFTACLGAALYRAVALEIGHEHMLASSFPFYSSITHSSWSFLTADSYPAACQVGTAAV